MLRALDLAKCIKDLGYRRLRNIYIYIYIKRRVKDIDYLILQISSQC